jgi:predicted ATPase
MPATKNLHNKRRRNQGKRDEARDLLALVYGWFIEGFDTRDLKETKALLDELAA